MIDVNPDYSPVPQPELDSNYDVIVIGGGPAGATTGALVAEYGHKTLVVDRAQFPRFHVGESLIPETYWSLKRLGLVEQLRQSAFPKKFSVQFVSDGHKVSEPFYFKDHKDCESSQSWQVVRGEFDKMLLDNAAAKGATTHTNAQVTEVLFDGDTAVGVKALVGEDRVEKTISCRVVVDATGQSAFLANRLKLKKQDELLRKATVWTYWKNAQRDPGIDEGCTIILQTAGKHSWFWYIPLPDNIVSVGCTGSLPHMFGDKLSAEEVYQRELSRCPALQGRLANAERCEDYFTTKDFSYKSSQAAGDGWVLTGDAFGFIDPVYSSGVYLAMKSGEFAADAINDAFKANQLTGERLGSWRDHYNEGVENFRKLVYAFYTPGFSFGGFLKEHPQFQSNLVDILIGDVFKPGVGDMFDVMGEVVPPSDYEVAATA
jgi:flavin-dependent dehydrogenase